MAPECSFECTWVSLGTLITAAKKVPVHLQDLAKAARKKAITKRMK